MTDQLSFRNVLRALTPLIGREAAGVAGSAMALERLQRYGDPPTVSACVPLESVGAYPVPDTATIGVSAFLDGIQRSRVVGHLAGSPLIFGTVAAVVRRRVDRRLTTWREPRIHGSLYGSRSQLGEPEWQRLQDAGVPVIDIVARESGRPSIPGDGLPRDGRPPDILPRDMIPPHPMAVRARALELVALERELLERQLAAEWCRSEREWLWIDGGISGNVAVDETACAFGVVKSHTTLYGDGLAVRAVLGLRTGERSALFLAGHRPRRAVASWYLRLRESADGDPLHGLVRVELAPPAAISDAIANEREPAQEPLRALSQQAATLSGWILAERAPVSRPDPRWDTLTYGVHACEEFLKAIVGA